MASSLLLHNKDARLQFRAILHKRERELQALRVLLNSSAAINKLPQELLVAIFRELQIQHTDWFDVLRVCRHWFVVGSTAATLWQTLWVSDSTNLLRTGLARSRAAEVEIVITKFLSHHFPEVTALITSHLHRVHNLELGSVPRSCMPAFTDIMRRDMPALRTLQVYFDTLEGEDIALELPPARFPRLTGVLIANIQILATPAIVSQLREIVILVCRGSSTPITTATFVHAIRAMRNVKVLHLRDVYACDAGSAPTLPAMDKVGLDQLHKLVVRTHASLVQAMLSAVIIPVTANVSFTCLVSDAPQADGSNTLQAVIPDDTECLPILSEVVEVFVTSALDNRDCELAGYTTPDNRSEYERSEGRRPSSDIDFRLRRREDVNESDFWLPLGLRHLTYIFPRGRAPLQSLIIHTAPAVILATDWPALFSTYPALRTLQLIVSDEEDAPCASMIFAALSPRSAADSETDAHGVLQIGGAEDADTIPCPNLRRLTLVGLSVSDPDLLVATAGAYLESRKRVLGASEGRMDRVVVILKDHNDEAHFDAVQASFEERLAPLVDCVAYRTSDTHYWD
ncbi:uncharacterized protein TRAVEDRAFT_74935 [Trametes versicolor FP-101664 SS1]|uniref:uncharacterized protein n=1 Tax=Trametes versicolor (strain FP-101664) TaxID=717944 RepID=UPI000462424E|nr:uncharacterized protein TRAVEDRAFT_74935 [Trametes versicolor FP-101664 SS1]EIW52528.1 hypothetical protein TRAVEDRAFT_74935 [Trametes versicolor FP-101664 SS1]